MAKVDPNDPNQVTREGHAEEPQADIQKRVERAEHDGDPSTSAATTNLDPVKKPEPKP